jgi:hypothetical protein
MAQTVHRPRYFGTANSMVLKIERISDKGRMRIRLSGGLRDAQIEQVKAEIDKARAGAASCKGVVLDLEEVDLVDLEAVHFLNTCQAEGVQMLHRSAYIRAWMLRERRHPATQGDV